VKLPRYPEPSLKTATAFRFRCLHLVVEVDLSRTSGWSWAIHDPERGRYEMSPKWHRTSKSAVRSAWAHLRREARKAPSMIVEWEVVKEPRIPGGRDRNWMCWRGRDGKYCGENHGNGKRGYAEAEHHADKLNRRKS